MKFNFAQPFNIYIANEPRDEQTQMKKILSHAFSFHPEHKARLNHQSVMWTYLCSLILKGNVKKQCKTPCL